MSSAGKWYEKTSLVVKCFEWRRLPACESLWKLSHLFVRIRRHRDEALAQRPEATDQKLVRTYLALLCSVPIIIVRYC